MKMLEHYRAAVETRLNELLPQNESLYNNLTDAMRYSIMLGGKRIRPAIMLEFFGVCGGTEKGIIDAACALEMIHTYSLIHDDLPCMDNDDMRRGKPSCHKAFGEAAALLAGDALLTYAFETVSSINDIPAERVVKACAVLAQNAGAHGMIGGQVIDLESEGRQVPLSTVIKTYELKTGCLIKAAANIGCILGGASGEKCAAACKYAECIGLAFQIQDDILDRVGNEQLLGKPIGSDEENQKTTYLSVMGLDAAKQKVAELTASAKEALNVFGPRAENLANLADYLLNREF